jgi:hypothetical protein
MSLSVDYINLIIESDATLSDMVAFHGDLRDIEASAMGILYPVIHTYKQLPIGGGAYIPGVGLINGWSLQFPAGDFEVRGGQFDGVINPVENCYVKVTQAGAYAVTSVGSVGLSQSDIDAVATQVLAELNATTIPANVKKINGVSVGGTGVTGDSWRPV